MNQESISHKTLFYLSFFIFFLFVAGHIWGGLLFYNNWSFVHWYFLSLWYLLGWGFGTLVIAYLFLQKGESIGNYFNTSKKIAITLALIFILFIIFQFDSFVYGGGNYLMAQIAQTDTIVLRWYEYGAIGLVAIFYKLVSIFNFSNVTAGYLSWKIYAFLGDILTLVAIVKLTRELSTDTQKRFFLFIILFFGPQTMLYFGFIGIEPMLIAVLYWFMLYAFRLNRQFTTDRLLALWFVTVVGIFINVTSFILLPSAVFITLKHPLKVKTNLSLILGFIIYVLLVGFAYFKASTNLEYAKQLLFISGKNIQVGYNLFSLKHIGDIIQLFFLAFPQVIILKVLSMRQLKSITKDANIGVLILLILSGNTLVFIREPVHSIVLDYPRFIVYLTPMAVLLAYLLSKMEDTRLHVSSLTKIMAVLAIVLPFSILPIYTRIKNADSYLDAYMRKNPNFYIEGATSLQDSYFYKKELDAANKWYLGLPNLSIDFLNFTAAKEYTAAEKYPQALKKLYKITSEHKYWTAPRELLATIQMKLRRYNLAKPEFDTCLMIEPYNKDFLIDKYRYYRDVNDFPVAIKNVQKTIKIYPKDNEIKADLAIFLYRIGDYKRADSLSGVLISADTTLAYPYLIRGLIAEVNKQSKKAIDNLQKFISLAPDAEETPQIRKRLNNLILQEQKQK